MENFRRSEGEDALRGLARALAPYIAEELERLRERASSPLSAVFDAVTCERFVEELGDGVLARSRVLFELLASQQVVDSLQLAQALGVTPRELSGHLTTPLKRRARALDLPLPFSGGLGAEPYGAIDSPSPDMDSQRTHWQDRDGIAARMLTAIDVERDRRNTVATPSTDSGKSRRSRAR